MAVALRLLKEGAGDAVISAGSTGALLTGATLTVKRIRGIRRAALAPVLPAGEHGVMLIDCGANVECTAEYLLQFAFTYVGRGVGVLQALHEAFNGLDMVGVGEERKFVQIFVGSLLGLLRRNNADQNGVCILHI